MSIGKARTPGYYLAEDLAPLAGYYAPAVSMPEVSAWWVGRGAEALGLGGDVTADALARLLQGQHPATGDGLIVTRRNVLAFDVTFSVPKSYSTAWALTADEFVAADVTAAVRAAHGAAVEYLERFGCGVRRGHNGVVRQPGGGFVAAGFLHHTSRAGDPNLHIHSVIGNIACGPDGRWTALASKELYQHRYAAEAVGQAVLRRELAHRLGWVFDPVDRHGVAEIAGFPPDLIRGFSKRRQVIETEMARRGVHSAKGARTVALATRAAKPDTVSEGVLRELWRHEADGFDVALLPRLRRPDPALVADHADLATRLTEQHATFRHRDVVRTVACSAAQGATLEEILAETDRFLASPLAVVRRNGLWTTQEILAIETRAASIATGGLGVAAALDRAAPALRTALEARPTLSAEQRAMVTAVATSGNRVDVVIGHPGAGKTYALDTLANALTASGFTIIGAAPSARAAAELQDATAIPSQTVASLLGDLDTGRRRLNPSTTLVVDEAGMTSTRHLARLIEHTDRAGGRVVLVGDPRQLPEIEAGGLFRTLANRLPASVLSGNLRQRDPQHVAALAELRAGHATAALGMLVRNGDLIAGPDHETLYDALVSDWYLTFDGGPSAVMLAPHRSDVVDLNERARSLMRRDGRLGAVLHERRSDAATFAAGDRIVALRNRYDYGVLNGDRGTITEATEGHLVVALDDGRRLAVARSYIDDGHLAHAYATTIHKAQGMTCDHTYLLADDAMYNELGYVGLSRGRHTNRIYTVAPVEPEVALDELADALDISHAKTAAIDLAPEREPRRDRGPSLGL